MEFENNSDFIDKGPIAGAELLEQYGSTSLVYKIIMDGQTFFMKKQRPELRNDPRVKELFYKEFNTGKSISSPYIVKYIDIKENADGLCIIMEYVNGQTIKEKIEKEPGYFRQSGNIKKLLMQLCKALMTLHSANVVHLDLNPSNIIISRTSNNLKLVDFGFCISDYNDTTAGTTTGFGAPEATMSEIENIDARTDIYSIGCLLQYIEEKSGAELPRYIRRIKKRCLRKQRTERYNSCDEIIREIHSNGKKRTMATTIAAVSLASLTLMAQPVYNAAKEYIAWESGKFGDRFEEEDIFYRITDHKSRTVAVTYKGNHHGEYMFEYKDGTIEIPATVTHLGRKFRVTSIDGNAFDNPETTGIIFPDGLESISDLAFVVCRLTGEVHIPQSIRHIGKLTFEGNTQISGFVVDEENTVYDSRGGCNAIIESATNRLVAACTNTVIPNDVIAIGENAFAMYQNTRIEIPESVTTIENNAFGQSALTEITLPCNITRIGGHAFENCTKLTKIISHIPPERLHPTGDGCFNGIPGNCILYVPRGAKAVYESTEGWNMFANIVEMETAYNGIIHEE
jgi:tRNA A-37 threonylcarbamoyl transferase component Bud32